MSVAGTAPWSGEDASAQIERAPDPPAWLPDARAMHGLPAEEPPVKSTAPDSSDPAVIKAAQRKARMDRRAMLATIGGMMESGDVRSWMYSLLETCRAFTSSDFPSGSSVDPYQLARNAAHREVGQFLIGDIMAACPDLFVVMVKENA